jgi:hypothetical protein
MSAAECARGCDCPRDLSLRTATSGSPTVRSKNFWPLVSTPVRTPSEEEKTSLHNGFGGPDGPAGLSNPEIRAWLFISRGTVQYRLQRVFSKVAMALARSRTECSPADTRETPSA